MTNTKNIKSEKHQAHLSQEVARIMLWRKSVRAPIAKKSNKLKAGGCRSYAEGFGTAALIRWEKETGGASGNKSFILKQISNAAEKLDASFFIGLGESLSSGMHLSEPGNLEFFLVNFWTSQPHPEIPELCRLTPSGLLEVCKCVLNNSNLTLEALVKVRYRLKLKPTRGDKYNVVKLGGYLEVTPATRRVDK